MAVEVAGCVQETSFLKMMCEFPKDNVAEVVVELILNLNFGRKQQTLYSHTESAASLGCPSK